MFAVSFARAVFALVASPGVRAQPGGLAVRFALAVLVTRWPESSPLSTRVLKWAFRYMEDVVVP